MITKNIVETPVFAVRKNGVSHHLFVNGGGKFFWDSNDTIFDTEDAAINWMRSDTEVEEIRCILPESNKRRRS